MHALRLVSKNNRYIARLYKPTRVAACYFSTTPALRQQVPPYQQNMQQHQQQQQHQHQQQQQQQQQEIVMPPGGAGEAVPQELVIEVTEKNMAMLEQKIPLVIDLYSHREGNTAAQTARLTQAVQNCEGAVRLARINVDRFPEVLDNMGITPELLPASVYIYGGRPIARHFGKGAVIESGQLDKYMQALLKVAGISSTRVVLKSAEQHLENGDIESARKIYEEILHNKQAKSEGMALAGLAQCALKENKIDEAEELLAVVSKNYKEDMENSYVKKAFAALDFAKASGGSNEADLLAKLKDNPKDLEAKYALAVLYSASGRAEEAMNEAIGIIKIDKQYNEQAARKLLLQIFEMLGSDHALTVKGRKRLSAVWYL